MVDHARHGSSVCVEIEVERNKGDLSAQPISGYCGFRHQLFPWVQDLVDEHFSYTYRLQAPMVCVFWHASHYSKPRQVRGDHFWSMGSTLTTASQPFILSPFMRQSVSTPHMRTVSERATDWVPSRKIQIISLCAFVWYGE